MNHGGSVCWRPRILVTSLFGHHNRGDWELALALFDVVRQAFPGCSIQALCRDPESLHAQFDGVSFERLLGASARPAGLRRRLESSLSFAIGFLATALGIVTGLRPNSLARSYRGADIIVAAPGGYLEDHNIGILLHVAHLWLALLARKPVLLAPITIGPLNSSVWRMLMSGVLRRVRLICVRESRSLALVREIAGADMVTVHMIPDMALYRSETDAEGAARLLADAGLAERPFVAMTVEDGRVPFYAGPAPRDPGYLASLVEVCRLLDAEGIAVLIWLQVETAGGIVGDEIAQENFLRRAPGNVIATRERMAPALVRGVLQRAAALVTPRLHPCIFATQVSCPFVSLSTEIKTRGVLSMLGLEEEIYDFSACDAPALHRRVHEAMRRKAAFEHARLRAGQLGLEGRQRLLELMRSVIV